MKNTPEINTKSQYVISEECLEKCCNKHGLPVECLEEDMSSRKVSKFNETHHEIKLVRSEKCHSYSGIMKRCKLKCIVRRPKEVETPTRISPDHELSMFRRKSDVSANMRHKGSPTAKGLKGDFRIYLMLILISVLFFLLQ